MRNLVIPDVGDVLVDRYRLDGILGRGGFGIVYRATHLSMNRVVAIKTLLPHVAASEDAVDRFRREAVLASSLTHPNTITLFDYGQTPDGLFYLVMEYLKGQTLKDRLRLVGRLAPRRVEAILVQVLKSLSEAHAKGIVHRDLKPENIFLCEVPGEQDFVKVLDFGIAKMVESGGHNPDTDLSVGGAFGTPKYMAPEQISAGVLGPHTDIYALGLIAYEMLVGRPGYDGNTPLEIIAKQANAPEPSLPAHLRLTSCGRLIERMIRKPIAERYQMASEALEALHGVSVAPSSSQSANGSLLGGGVESAAASGWNSGNELVDSGRFLSEGVLQDGVGDVMESDATMVQMNSDDHVFDSNRFLSETSLGEDLGDLEEEATQIDDGSYLKEMEVEATSISPDRLRARAPAFDPMEAEPTRVKLREDSTVNLDADDLLEIHTDHRAEVAQRAAAADLRGPGAGGLQPLPGAQPAGRHSPAMNSPSIRVNRQEALSSDAQALQRAPASPADASVLFSVADAAAHLPGQAPAPAPAGTEPTGPQVAQMSFGGSTTNHGRPKGLDKNLVVALTVLGLGMVAVMMVVMIWLLLPLIKGEEARPTATPIAVAGSDEANDDEAGDDEARDDKDDGGDATANTVLMVTSEPAGAEVLVDGKKIGVTPLDIKRTQPRGVVNLVVRKVGFEDDSQDLTYEGNRELHVELRKKAGEADSKVAAKVRADPPAQKKAAPRGGGSTGGAKAPAARTNKPPAGQAGRKPPVKKKTPTRSRRKRGGGKKNPFGKW